MESKTRKKIVSIILSVKEREFSTASTYEEIFRNSKIAWCWGAFDFVGVKDDGLVFKVNGALHKGYVIVTLGYEDLYKVTLADLQGNIVGKTKSGVYNDCLIDVIDKLVETP